MTTFLAGFDRTLIVYGTLDEVATNREAAEARLQRGFEPGTRTSRCRSRPTAI